MEHFLVTHSDYYHPNANAIYIHSSGWTAKRNSLIVPDGSLSPEQLASNVRTAIVLETRA